jgi:hypothetical protein
MGSAAALAALPAVVVESCAAAAFSLRRVESSRATGSGGCVNATARGTANESASFGEPREAMNPYFYSLGMLVTRRTTPAAEALPLSAMDLLAAAIADEEKEPSKLIAFLLAPASTTKDSR